MTEILRRGSPQGKEGREVVMSIFDVILDISAMLVSCGSRRFHGTRGPIETRREKGREGYEME